MIDKDIFEPFVDCMLHFLIGKYIVDSCKVSNNLQGGIINRFVN